MKAEIIKPKDILDFWFQEIEQKSWWQKDSVFDAMLAKRFGAIHTKASLGELFIWRESKESKENAEGRLAEIIILDQFSRNIYRDKPKSFAFDTQALVLAQEAVSLNVLDNLEDSHKSFLLMPYMHSESKVIHENALILFKENAPANLEFEIKHKLIIDRFGRYPHRNVILNRHSSDEEVQFLKEPNSSF